MEERVAQLEQQVNMVLILLRATEVLDYYKNEVLSSEVLNDFHTDIEQLKEDFRHLDWQVNRDNS